MDGMTDRRDDGDAAAIDTPAQRAAILAEHAAARRQRVIAARAIADRPGFPESVTEAERVAVLLAAAAVRAWERWKTGRPVSLAWDALLKRVDEDTRRVLKAERAVKHLRRRAKGSRRGRLVA